MYNFRDYITVGEVQQRELEVAGGAVAIIRKQGAINAYLMFCLLFSLGLPQVQWVFPPWLP